MLLPLFLTNNTLNANGMPDHSEFSLILTAPFYQSTSAANDWRWSNQYSPQYAVDLANGWSVVTSSPDTTNFPMCPDGFLHPSAGQYYDLSLVLLQRTREATILAGAVGALSTTPVPGYPLGG